MTENIENINQVIWELKRKIDENRRLVDRLKAAGVCTTVEAIQPAGAQELLGAYRGTQLTLEDFNGPRYVRLAQLKQLVQSGALDETLRWRD